MHYIGSSSQLLVSLQSLQGVQLLLAADVAAF
jgi:hypothetical protein